MKKSQTAKYRRRRRKELANRKARQLSTQQSKPAEVSPARRAFQDV